MRRFGTWRERLCSKTAFLCVRAVKIYCNWTVCLIKYNLSVFMEAGALMENEKKFSDEYIVVKAKENGVNVIGMTRGKDTRLLHTERLNEGEVLIAQFTDNTSAIKISGRATVLTRHGEVEAGE